MAERRTLADAAEEPEQFRLADDLPGVYRLVELELTPAEDIGDEYPQYGDFVLAEHPQDGETYLEAVTAFAQFLVNDDAAPQDVFVVERSTKPAEAESWNVEGRVLRSENDVPETLPPGPRETVAEWLNDESQSSLTEQ